MLWTRLWCCWCWCWFWFGKNRQCIAMPKQNLILRLEKKIRLVSGVQNDSYQNCWSLMSGRGKKTWLMVRKKKDKVAWRGLIFFGNDLLYQCNGWTTWMDWMCGAGLYTFLFPNCTHQCWSCISRKISSYLFQKKCPETSVAQLVGLSMSPANPQKLSASA